MLASDKKRKSLPANSAEIDTPKTKEHWDIEIMRKTALLDWKCLTCQYPQCATQGCTKRYPKDSGPFLYKPQGTNNRYFCPQCAKKREREDEKKNTRECGRCGQRRELTAEHWSAKALKKLKSAPGQTLTCLACHGDRGPPDAGAQVIPCRKCNVRYPKTSEHYDLNTYHKPGKWMCLTCQYPRCIKPGCGRQRPREEGPQRQQQEHYVCSRCANDSFQCRTCNQRKEKSQFADKNLKEAKQRGKTPTCRECEKKEK